MVSYGLTQYGQMIADPVRMRAFCQALRRVVTPDTVVLDIGTGTGIFAMLACQYGARHVYAVEPNDTIDIAKRMAAANGLADRITFSQQVSTQMTLPEPAHVIISDLRGLLLWFEQHIPSIVDARRRLLAPGGVLIPQCDVVWAAVVEAPDLYHTLIQGWANNPYGLDMSIAQRMVTNSWTGGRVRPYQLLTAPQEVATLDYTTVEDHDVNVTLTWPATRDGMAYGVSVWFDRTLAEGITLSHAPDAPPGQLPPYIHGNVFFPWVTPVPLAEADTVAFTLRGVLDGDYVWSWTTAVHTQGDPGAVKANFSQTTMFGKPLRVDVMQKRAVEHEPILNEAAQVVQAVLSLMDGETSLETIAQHMANRFPSRFASAEEAMKQVADLSELYSA